MFVLSDSSAVLHLFRVVATPITRGWSCSPSDFRRRSSGVSKMMTKSFSPRYESYFDIHCWPNLKPKLAFSKSLESAKTVVTVLIDSLVPTGYIRFAPDGA